MVFDYLYHAGKTRLAIEVRPAESLKHSYALQQGHPMIRGYFRNLTATITAPGPKLSFETLLDGMFGAGALNPNMTQMVRLRNELIHQG